MENEAYRLALLFETHFPIFSFSHSLSNFPQNQHPGPPTVVILKILQMYGFRCHKINGSRESINFNLHARKAITRSTTTQMVFHPVVQLSHQKPLCLTIIVLLMQVRISDHRASP